MASLRVRELLRVRRAHLRVELAAGVAAPRHGEATPRVAEARRRVARREARVVRRARGRPGCDTGDRSEMARAHRRQVDPADRADGVRARGRRPAGLEKGSTQDREARGAGAHAGEIRPLCGWARCDAEGLRRISQRGRHRPCRARRKGRGAYGRRKPITEPAAVRPEARHGRDVHRERRRILHDLRGGRGAPRLRLGADRPARAGGGRREGEADRRALGAPVLHLARRRPLPGSRLPADPQPRRPPPEAAEGRRHERAGKPHRPLRCAPPRVP